MNAARQSIESELDSSEHLLWAGVPRQGIVFFGSDAVLIPVSIFFGVIFPFIAAIVTSSIVASLVCLPLVLFAIYPLVGRFLDVKMRSRTFYGVTSHRVIMVSGIFKRKVSSLNLKDLHDITFDERPDGSGDIRFEPYNPQVGLHHGMYDGTHSLLLEDEYGNSSFNMIDDVRKVYGIIRQAKGAVGVADQQ